MSAGQPKQPKSEKTADGPSSSRLAELVAHLTDCSPEHARAAVEAVKTGEPADSDAALEVVARAMSAVRRIDLRDRVDLRDTNEDHTPIT